MPIVDQQAVFERADVARLRRDLALALRAAEHQQQILAAASGFALAQVAPALTQQVAAQVQGERMQSDLLFESLRRRLGDR